MCGHIRVGNTSEVAQKIGNQKGKSGDSNFRDDLKNSTKPNYVQVYNQLCSVEDLFAKEVKVHKSCRKDAYNLNKKRLASADATVISSSSKSQENRHQATTTSKSDRAIQHRNKQNVIDYVDNEIIALNLVASIDDIVQVYYECTAEDKSSSETEGLM